MITKYIRPGPAQALKDISDDGLKLLRRGLFWGIAPSYYRGTLQEVEAELRRRKIPLRRLNVCERCGN